MSSIRVDHIRLPPGHPAARHQGDKVAGDDETARHLLKNSPAHIGHPMNSPAHKAQAAAAAAAALSKCSIESNPNEVEMSPARPNTVPRLEGKHYTKKEQVDYSSDTSPTSNGAVTWTGTIKRGGTKSKSKTKPADEEIQLELTKAEIEKLNASIIQERDDRAERGCCGLRKGLHILFISLLSIPFAFLASLVFAFYIGTIAWYNIYVYLSEERTIWHKIFLCPLLILFYPFLIGISAVGIALYAMFVQVSWYCASWLKEWRNLEKGFYGGVCNTLRVPQCAPYEVIILDEPMMQPPGGTSTATSAAGEQAQVEMTAI